MELGSHPNFVFHFFAGTFLSLLAWICSDEHLETIEIFTVVLIMYFVCFMYFFTTVRYEKKCLNCYLYGDVLPAKSVKITRGMYGKPYIVYEFTYGNKSKKSRCIASTNSIKNFNKNSSVFILRVVDGGGTWILERESVSILSLSNIRVTNLLQHLG